jgi:hypothetical protein
MDYEKIKTIQERLRKKKERRKGITDPLQREILRLEIGIDEYKVRIERLKK